MMKKGKNKKNTTPGYELGDSPSAGEQSSYCATCTRGNRIGKFSYIIRYSRLKYPKTPFHGFFQVQWLTATLIFVDISHSEWSECGSQKSSHKKILLPKHCQMKSAARETLLFYRCPLLLDWSVQSSSLEAVILLYWFT